MPQEEASAFCMDRVVCATLVEAKLGFGMSPPLLAGTAVRNVLDALQGQLEMKGIYGEVHDGRGRMGDQTSISCGSSNAQVTLTGDSDGWLMKHGAHISVARNLRRLRASIGRDGRVGVGVEIGMASC
nr:hypothetical protein CFP56_52374 [Quercus suber]